MVLSAQSSFSIGLMRDRGGVSAVILSVSFVVEQALPFSFASWNRDIPSGEYGVECIMAKLFFPN